jgi:hypothetical protein
MTQEQFFEAENKRAIARDKLAKAAQEKSLRLSERQVKAIETQAKAQQQLLTKLVKLLSESKSGDKQNDTTRKD